MSDSFESLGLAPWIVRQTATLGKYFNDIRFQMRLISSIQNRRCNNQLYFNIFFRIEETHVDSTELHTKNLGGFWLHWGSENWVMIYFYWLPLKTTFENNSTQVIIFVLFVSKSSGKTFAFALPILQRLSEEPTHHFALILTPTHELAYQISEQFSVAGQPMGVRVCVVAGGTDQMIESQKLQNRPHIVVAMPGRLADHLTGCDTFSFDNLKYLVVDEADRMLGGAFDEHLAIIESCLPKERQNLFFSATLKDFLKESSICPISNEVIWSPDYVLLIAWKSLFWKILFDLQAFEWSEESDVATVNTLDQRYVLCADYDRDMVLIEVLRKYREENETANAMIFTNTKKWVLYFTNKQLRIDWFLDWMPFKQMLPGVVDDIERNRHWKCLLAWIHAAAGTCRCLE